MDGHVCQGELLRGLHSETEKIGIPMVDTSSHRNQTCFKVEPELDSEPGNTLTHLPLS